MIGQFRVVASVMRYIVEDLRQIPEEHLGMHYTLQRALTVHPCTGSGWLPRKMTNNEKFQKCKNFGGCSRSPGDSRNMRLWTKVDHIKVYTMVLFNTIWLCTRSEESHPKNFKNQKFRVFHQLLRRVDTKWVGETPKGDRSDPPRWA